MDFLRQLTQIKFQNDETIADIYNGLESPPWYGTYYDLLPGLYAMIAITIAHYLLDIISHNKAREFAREATKFHRSSWMTQFMSQVYPNNIDSTSKDILLSKKEWKELQEKADSQSKYLNESQISELQSYKRKQKQFEKHISKFQESLFKVIVFGFIYFYGLYILATEDFFWNCKKMWDNGLPQYTNKSIIFYYAIELGYHGHRALYQFLEHRRSDFWAMFIHHWVTGILISYSWMLGYVQTGCIVMLCNDNTDLLMPAAKLFGYLKWKSLESLCKTLFLILWIPFRICLYPYKVLYNILNAEYGGYNVMKKNGYAWICVIGLCIIYSLQFYWTRLLLVVLWRKITGEDIVDIRSDKEEGESSKKHKYESQKHK